MHERLETIDERPGDEQPDLTVLMPIYRQRAFAGDAIRSVLAQDGCVLEILISDDQSDDATLRAAQSALRRYRGPHSIRLLRTRARLRMDHLGTLVAAASRPFMIQAHGDDISEPGRMASMLALHRRSGAALVTSLSLRLDGRTCSPRPMPTGFAEGLVPDEQAIGKNPGVFAGALYGLHRDIYQRFPPLTAAYLPRGHDVLQAFRALLTGGVWLSAAHLVRRRHHPDQWSRQLWDTRMPPARAFGYALSKLGVIAAMRSDLVHFSAAAPDDSRPAILRGLVEAEERRMLDQLLAARHELRALGYEPQWQPMEAIGRGNRRPLRWPPAR